jgi:hypothetical protein
MLSYLLATPQLRTVMSQPYPASGTLHSGLWIKKVPSVYTPGQVSQYLSAVRYDPVYNAEAIGSAAFPLNRDSLERLMRHHLLTFPFENTGMH